MNDFEPVIKKERGLPARSTDRRLKPEKCGQDGRAPFSVCTIH
jgi:hypothetical protein